MRLTGVLCGGVLVAGLCVPAPLMAQNRVEQQLILDLRDLFQPHRCRHAVMDYVMVGRGEPAGQLHREPVFLPGFRVERQPRKMARAFFEIGVRFFRQFGVRVGDFESHGARAAVGEQGQILARFQSELDRFGVNTALESAGVQPGDTVRIAGVEFEYQP